VGSPIFFVFSGERSVLRVRQSGFATPGIKPPRRFLMKFHCLLAFAAIFTLCAAPGQAQVYSYVDQNGVRVFTNIPPTGPVWDLKVSGAPPTPAAPPNPAPKAMPKVANSKPVAQGRPVSQQVNNANGASPGGPAVEAPNPKTGAYDDIIQKHAASYNIDPKLIRYMIATESGFNPKAISPKGAQGLMQLMPQTAFRLGVRNPLDPEENILGGVKYMRFLLDTFAGNPDEKLALSLAAYNAGENLVQRLGRVPDIPETSQYVSSIIQRYGKTIMDEVAELPPARVLGPSTFHYFDENGVLVLTNIPPVNPSNYSSKAAVR
jgi:hypothetical protein